MRRLAAVVVIACAPPPKVAPHVGDLYRAPDGRCQVRVATPYYGIGLICDSPSGCEDRGKPAEVDCPEELLDPHEISNAPPRPEGREGWLRVKPVLVLINDQVCTYEPDRYCRPPGDPFACEPARKAIPVDCEALDGSPFTKPTRWLVASIRYTDAAGKCRVTTARECSQTTCEHIEGDLTACP